MWSISFPKFVGPKMFFPRFFRLPSICSSRGSSFGLQPISGISFSYGSNDDKVSCLTISYESFSKRYFNKHNI